MKLKIRTIKTRGHACRGLCTARLSSAALDSPELKTSRIQEDGHAGENTCQGRRAQQQSQSVSPARQNGSQGGWNRPQPQPGAAWREPLVSHVRTQEEVKNEIP